MTKKITIIGGGLAGCEAAWQAARSGVAVRLYDMKPERFSPAHHSPHLAELVCSNSFRAADPANAVGLLKEEMRRLDSLIIGAAMATQVPAGRALAVDRAAFSARITETLAAHPAIELIREEVLELPPENGEPVVLATGPLTSDAMAASLITFMGEAGLAFYDAIAPIVVGESLNRDIIYEKSRYQDGPGDYLNCPLEKDEYFNFISELRNGQCVPPRPFEEPRYFEGCLPIEVLLARGDETLRFGPMKPVGLENPQSGRRPYAVAQLRREDAAGLGYNMVGFQTKLRHGEQKRIFRLIPGMERAEFLRLGSIHRNTFIRAPNILTASLQTRKRPTLFIAGQLAGVEGYVESAAMGLVAGINAARLATNRAPLTPPAETALGALIAHLTASEPQHFQPSNVTFGLFPPLPPGKMGKKERGRTRAAIALAALEVWRNLLD
ncbi:MAG: methylenetetrahydrofolate--tRNA-(uracil(54)-C(5))-methyltransferase (FADH(2)-oxidizing) TrmFO [Desulfobulbaceae bacterium]|nr:methylenetetrahydrofolate--tRNA-(uracil(54)-C(5))-methyltransferase (FADH(2)-oxidizing) TrmFO [Desulfobulbaceae bacterium]